MSPLVVPALVAAGLLAVAGATKVLDPVMTAGALRAAGWPVPPLLVRAGAAAELGIAVAAIVAGGAWLWGAVALSYAAFAVFVALALRRGTPIATCGCFGRADTPPSQWHVVVDLWLALAAMCVARWLDVAPLDELADHPALGAGAVVLAGGLGGLAYAVLTRRPAAAPR